MSEQESEVTAIPGEENLDTSGAVLSAQERAEAVGWHEKDGGLSAEEFIAKRDDHVGLLRNDVKKLEQSLAESTAVQTSMAEFLQKSRADAQRQGYDKAIADAKARMEQAVDDSDGEAFTVASRQKDQLEDGKSKVANDSIIASKPQVNPVQQDIMNHQAAHPELFDDSSKEATWQAELLFQGQRGASFEDSVAAADRLVRKNHLPSRPHSGPVDGETASGVVSDFANLGADAKKAYARFHKANPDFTKEAYLKSYNEAG